MLKRWGIGFALAAFMTAPTWAAPISIDEFTEPTGNPPPQTLTVSPAGAAGTTATAGSQATGLPALKTISGTRDLWVQGTLAAGTDGFGTVSAKIVGSPPSSIGALTVDAEDDVESRVVVQWDGDDSVPGPAPGDYGTNVGMFGPVDLTDAGTNDRFWVRFTRNEPGFAGTVLLTMQVWTSPSSSSTFTAVSQIPPASGLIALPFASFVGTANFASIDGIEMMVEGQAGADYTIDYVRVVPEPGTFAILGFAAVAGVIRRRKRA